MEDFDNFDDGDDFMDDDGNFYSDDDGLNEETQDESKDEDNGIDIGWEDMAIIGGMAEEFSFCTNVPSKCGI